MAVISVKKKLRQNGKAGEKRPQRKPIQGKAAPKIANPEKAAYPRVKVGCVEVVPSHGPIWTKGVYVLIGWKTDINWAVVNHPAG